MDATPAKPAPIQGYRSRAINAVADFADALRPVAGPGVRVTDGPSGKIIAVDRSAAARLPRPWSCRLAPTTATGYPARVTWMVRLWLGAVVDIATGDELALDDTSPLASSANLATYSAADAVLDDATGLTRIDLALDVTAAWLVAARTSSGYSLAWSLTPWIVESGEILAEPVAYVDVSGGAPAAIRELLPGLIRLGSRAGLMPFDIVPTDTGYAVYVGSSSAVAINNDDAISCASTIDADGYIDIGSSPAAAWLWVASTISSSGSSASYYWGVSTSSPSSYSYRYVARWQIGAISSGLISQYWRGRIRIADDGCDDASIERSATDSNLLQLYQFGYGATTSATLDDIALLYRDPASGSPGDTFYLRYLAGTDLRSQVQSIITSDISSALSEFLSNLLDPTTSEGMALLNYFVGKFQPVVSTATTADGTDNGEYVGIAPSGSTFWTPHT